MNNIFSTIKVIWKTGKKYFNGASVRSLLKRLNFLSVAYLHLVPIHQWVNSEVSEEFQRELKRSLILLKIIAVPYIHNDWTFEERLSKISTHYRLISDKKLAFLNFSKDFYWNCAEFDIGDKKFRILIDRPPWMRSEGELTVSLFLDVNRIYSAAFSMGTENNKLHLLVGAIQGATHATNDSTYSDLTKVFHGARPRDMMVNIIKMIAQNLDCTVVWAISDEFHQSVGRGNEIKRASRYNEIWLENGGLLGDSGFFVMNSTLHKRPDADIPARKRALYRRRYELLDALDQKLKTAFAADQKNIFPHRT